MIRTQIDILHGGKELVNGFQIVSKAPVGEPEADLPVQVLE
jgi:hypothetical protein